MILYDIVYDIQTYLHNMLYNVHMSILVTHLGRNQTPLNQHILWASESSISQARDLAENIITALNKKAQLDAGRKCHIMAEWEIKIAPKGRTSRNITVSLWTVSLWRKSMYSGEGKGWTWAPGAVLGLFRSSKDFGEAGICPWWDSKPQAICANLPRLGMLF